MKSRPDNNTVTTVAKTSAVAGAVGGGYGGIMLAAEHLPTAAVAMTRVAARYYLNPNLNFFGRYTSQLLVKRAENWAFEYAAEVSGYIGFPIGVVGGYIITFYVTKECALLLMAGYQHHQNKNSQIAALTASENTQLLNTSEADDFVIVSQPEETNDFILIMNTSDTLDASPEGRIHVMTEAEVEEEEAINNSNNTRRLK